MPGNVAVIWGRVATLLADVSFLLCTVLASTLAPVQEPTAPAQPPATETRAAAPRVLFLTHSAGFTHSVVKRVERGQKAHAEAALTRAAHPMFEVDCTQDCGAITAANLARYAAVVFYTTGELPIADADREALIAYVHGGGGFVGVHSATDTYYRYPAYGDLIGGWFDGHPWHQEVRVRVEDRSHPTTFHLGATFEITDEIYQFKNWSREKVHVLLSLTPDLTDLSKGKRSDQDYALSWCRDVGAGRMFYTALGHRPEVWDDGRFLSHLLAGVRWTMGRADLLTKAPPAAVRLCAPGEEPLLRHADGGALRWDNDNEDGVLTVSPGSGGAVSKQPFADARIHVEFMVPADDTKEHGNSGVYIQRRYEVQILDSAGAAPDSRRCGGIYGFRPPSVNAALPSGQWQSFDVWFCAARFDADGNKVENARISVVHNGIVVHADVELPGPTGAGLAEGPEAQPLLLQDHGSAVSFRNLWIVRR